MMLQNIYQTIGIDIQQNQYESKDSEIWYFVEEYH